MKTANKRWSHWFPRGESVQILNDAGDVIQLEEVFTRGDGFLHFLVSSDDPVYERMKFSNRVQVRSLTSLKKLEGELSLVDHRPGFFDRAIGDGPAGTTDRQLLKFQPSSGGSGDNTSKRESLNRDLRAWTELFHLHSLPATLVPIFLGFIYALWMGWTTSGTAGLLALTGGILLHLASNIHNELSDFHHSLLNQTPIQDNPINDHRLKPSLVWAVALVFYGISVLAGLPVLYLRGGNFLAIGVLAFLIASFYSLHEHRTTNDAVLRDVSMFVLMGPLMSVAASIAVSGQWDLKLCLVSVPVGLFVALILHEHEIYSIPIDRRAGATTLALLLGFHGSKLYYAFLLFSGYAAIGIMTVFGFIPVWTLLSYLSLPYAVHTLRILRKVESPLNPRMSRLRYSTVLLNTFFGVFYLAGFLTEIYL